jgi:hypothetical protein
MARRLRDAEGIEQASGVGSAVISVFRSHHHLTDTIAADYDQRLAVSRRVGKGKIDRWQRTVGRFAEGQSLLRFELAANRRKKVLHIEIELPIGLNMGVIIGDADEAEQFRPNSAAIRVHGSNIVRAIS